MLTEKDFLLFLNDNTLDGSLIDNLRETIDLELEKPEDEMDTDLIEYCLNEIKKHENSVRGDNGIHYANGTKNRTRFKFKKIVALIAIVSMLLVSSISVSAFVFDVSIFEGIVEFYNEHFKINFDKVNNKADDYKLLDTNLAKELADNGFEEVLLPETLTEEDYKIKNIKYEKKEVGISANIEFENKNQAGYIYICKYDSQDSVPYNEYYDITGVIKTLELTKTTVYFVEHNNFVSINYRDGVYLYTILVPSNLEEAEEIAKTIK